MWPVQWTIWHLTRHILIQYAVTVHTRQGVVYATLESSELSSGLVRCFEIHTRLANNVTQSLLHLPTLMLPDMN